MNILDIIEKKKNNEALSREEIEFFFEGYLNKDVKDYQMSSLLMAICINGMNDDEIFYLTDIMLHSGKIIEEGKIEGLCTDKHSTGGVGDKTSLIIGPLLASLGIKVAKLSGKGLGHTGGTVDKLNSIPGFRTKLSIDEFIEKANSVGFVEAEQTDDFTPLDREIYALRSVSGTTCSLPLIASSIMSKKLAVGCKYILINITVGSGGLIKNKSDAIKLAKILVNIGNKYQKKVLPVITDMSKPLGDNIGNSLEIKEAIEVLKGKKGRLRNTCLNFASILYSNIKNVDMNSSLKIVTEALDDKRAYNKFLEFITSQGGDLNKLKYADKVVPIKSIKTGTIKSIDAYKVGMLSLDLGAGRKEKDASIDYEVGIILNKHSGENVRTGDVLCFLYQNDDKDRIENALNLFDIN